MRRAQVRRVAQQGRRLQVRISVLIPAIVLVVAAAAPLATGPTIATAAAAGDPVIAAAGDIACDPTNSHFNGGNGDSGSCRQRYTSDTLVNGGFAKILALGDNQYYCGGLAAFQQSYDLSWGRVKAATRPVVGNHEYLTSGGTGCDPSNTGAAGYFTYFGSLAGQPNQGYYSFDVGSWHIVALNSNCTPAGGCSSKSPQYTWLAADLASHPTACTLAYWHIPLFSSGGRAASNMRSLWALLYDNNADLVLSGHDHIYERFAPQTSTGVLDTARGLRSFIVGTGGANHTSIVTVAANSEVQNASTYGVLALTLHPNSYDWSFVPEAGKTFADTGTGSCHQGSSSDTTPPTVPQGLAGSSVAGPAVALSWSPSSDNVGVTSYGVYRNQSFLGLSSSPSYTDSTVAAGTTYQYAVDARDAAGNISAQSASVSVTVGSSSSLTFTPTADAYIRLDQPSVNFGTSTTDQVDNSPVKRSLIRFSISGIGAKGVASARLRVYCVDSSSSGGEIRSVAGSWTEPTVTWNTSPPFGPTAVSSLGSVHAGTWYEFDVTPLVTGNGDVTIGILSANADGADYVSREGAAGQRPQLVVTPRP